MVESGTSDGGILTSSFIWAMTLLAMGETVATEEEEEDVVDEGIGFSVDTTFEVIERRHSDDDEVDSTMSRFGVDSPVDIDGKTGGDDDDLIGEEEEEEGAQG